MAVIQPNVSANHRFVHIHTCNIDIFRKIVVIFLILHVYVLIMKTGGGEDGGRVCRRGSCQATDYSSRPRFNICKDEMF